MNKERNFDPVETTDLVLETTGEVVSIVTSLLESAISPLELIGSLMKIISLFMNFFNPQPDPFDIINKKLDEILKKQTPSMKMLKI